MVCEFHSLFSRFNIGIIEQILTLVQILALFSASPGELLLLFKEIPKEWAKVRYCQVFSMLIRV